jgi:hypothetical protein
MPATIVAEKSAFGSKSFVPGRFWPWVKRGKKRIKGVKHLEEKRMRSIRAMRHKLLRVG